ncbi:MAG: hypothetical protein KAR62_07725 [Sphingomonadales bacterium]|nr:hypothetical protein [Sphingomonadales bacterium]
MSLALLAQAANSEGTDTITIKALVEEASEVGAAKALARCGLHDENAGADIRALRDVLGAWRDARRVAWRSAVKWVITIIFALVLAGLATKMNFDVFNKTH